MNPVIGLIPLYDDEKESYWMLPGHMKVLEQCGLVDSAKGFDSYLCKNKLDGYVKAGTFTATKGMSYAQLAKIITRK